jgi:pSer/pThr/pTyr-binding forkhead associated (FHA) protein/DNA-binding CsgD family transcriptional regulator
MALSPLAPHSSSPSELKDRVHAERVGNPFLLYRDGGDNQRILDLTEAPDELTVGRRPSNQIPLSWDLSVSRIHALLERVGDYWTVSDDGLSRNGSFVNGSRVVGRRRLIDGDLMRFGDTVIAYCDPERGESRATADQEELPTVSTVSEAQRRVLLALCRPYKNSDGFAAPASNKQIADELCIGIDAVKSHMRALFYVFGVGKLPQNQKRAHLVERAFRTGVVTDRDL